MNNEFEKILERAEDVGVLARRVYARIDPDKYCGFLYKDPDFTIPVKEDELYTLFEKGGEIMVDMHHPIFLKIKSYVAANPENGYNAPLLMSQMEAGPFFSPESEGNIIHAEG